MKRLTVRSCALVGTTALCLVSVLRLSAQATAPAAGPKPTQSEETLVLSPFVVDATEDEGSYTAKSTLAGTRVRTDLKDVASAISIVTQAFLQDTGSKNSQDLLVYTPSTEVAGLNGNFSGQGGASVYQEQLVNPSNTTRVRGLAAADNTRDFFLTDIPWDGFNVGRVDLQRGPNSILFGVGSPAGIINTSLNTAGFKTGYKFENVTSKYGGERNLLDVNQVLVANELAVRFAAVNDQQRYQQQYAFNNQTRYYGALRFEPKLFNMESAHTSIRADYENGRIKSNNPRTQPPEDMISPFFKTGNDAYGNANLNKQLINQYTPGQGPNSALVNGTYNKGGYAQGRTYWPTVLSYFNGSSANTPGVSPAILSNIPTNVISGQINTGWAIDTNGNISAPSKPGNGPGIGGLPAFRPVAIPNYQQVAANTNIPGGGYYADVTMTDTSIFDFFNKLLDGPNKREWQNWNAYNVALSQTFLNDRLAFEVVYDKQDYKQGQIGFLQGTNYAIEIDPNVTFADGTANPNVGRPYVANSAAGGNTETKTVRENTRFTVYGEIHVSDYLKGEVGKILGMHRFTGLLNLDRYQSKDYQWSQYATDLGWEQLNNLDQSVKISNYRQFDWVAYVGPTLLGASSAAGAKLNGITNIIAPPSTNSVRYFNSHWNKPTSPSAPGYVNPNDPYTTVNFNTGATVTSTQNNNPANYVGWQTAAVNWLNASNPADFQSLITGGKTLKSRNTSKGLTWQGFLLDGDLAATYGWRKDNLTTYSTSAPVDSATGVTALDYSTDASSRRQVSGQSRTWGGVYHLPKSIMSKLPGGMGLSLYYDKSANIQVASRTNLAGGTVPNPDGQTKEYGLTFTALEDKLSLKIGKYNTVVHNSTFNVTNGNSIAGLGGNGYWLWAAPAWGYGYAANLQYGLDGRYGSASSNTNNWNYAYQDLNNVGASASALAAVADPAGAGFLASAQATQEKAIVNAWLNLPVSDGFFNYFGIAPSIDPSKAHASGKLYDAFSNWNNGSPVGAQQPGAINSISTVDNVSVGYEYELNYQPMKNWNVTVNYTKVQATKTNIDPATVKFMADNLAFFNGPGGQLRLWGVGGTAIGPNWVTNVYNPYLVSALAAGQSTPEVSPWRLNFVSTYQFESGELKNSFVGGALRVEAGRIEGYKYNPTTLALDVGSPYIGPNDKHYDLWVGYKSKFIFARKLNWRIQLNLRNVGESTKLVPVRYQPDGTLANSRIQEGMSWQLTNTFEF